MRLFLIKHARPIVTPGKLPEEWPLGDEGRAAARKLADELRQFNIRRVFHSDEIKAIDTAKVISEKLGVPVDFRQDIHEHDRSNVPQMRSGEFISYIELFFRKPDELVLGKETANECLSRYKKAIERIIAEHNDGDIAVVSHGTAMALYLAQLGAGRPFEIWRRMGLPSYAAIELPSMKCTQIVDRVG